MGLLDLLCTLYIFYYLGSLIEKSHYKKIKNRERALMSKPYISFGKRLPEKLKVKEAKLVTGEVVISGDYFKHYVAKIKNMFGGRLTTYESILDRARREATLRMREKAPRADVIVNVKLESVMLNNIEKNTIPTCAVIAYGTAVTYAR